MNVQLPIRFFKQLCSSIPTVVLNCDGYLKFKEHFFFLKCLEDDVITDTGESLTLKKQALTSLRNFVVQREVNSFNCSTGLNDLEDIDVGEELADSAAIRQSFVEYFVPGGSVP